MADTDWSFLRDNALSILAASGGKAFRHALAVGILLEAALATAPGSVSLWSTDGIVTTRQAGTRIDASGSLAGELTGTIIILGAF